MFALILAAPFVLAAPSVSATAAGYAEVCSGNVSDLDCGRLIATGNSPAEQEMLKLDCSSSVVARCETAWTKVLAFHAARPKGMVGFVPEPAPPTKTVAVEAKVTVTAPPVVEEDPCARGFTPKRGKGYVGSIRGKDGRECFGPSTVQSKDMAVFYNNRHDPSLVVSAGIRRQEENARQSAYVIEIGGDVVEQEVQPSPGKPLETSLMEVSGVPETVLRGVGSGIQYRVDGGESVDHSPVFQVSDRGLPYVSGVVGWTETRAILSGLVGHIVLYKFVRTTGDVWVYEGARSFDYDVFAHGGVREILPAIGDWRR